MATYTDTKYPGALDDTSTLPLYTDPPAAGDVLNAAGNSAHHAKHNVLVDAIKAVQAKLGISSSSPVDTPAAGLILASDASGKSKWIGGVTQIADTLLGVAATNITFPTIPGTFKHLQIVLQARGDGAVTFDNLDMQFNADTGANYDWENSQGNNVTASATNGAAATAARVGVMPAASATRAAIAGAATIWIPNYTSTTFEKSYVSTSGEADSTAGNSVARSLAGSWRNTAAITQVLLKPVTSTNFVAGTRATLYGWS